MRNFKLSTARDIDVFVTDSADHIAGKTGLGSALTITTSKAGAGFASISPTVVELASGWYRISVIGSMVDTLGDLAWHITAAGADPCDFLTQVTVHDPLDVATAAAAAVWTYVLEGARTTRGVLRRLDALVKGKATGLISAIATFYADDGATKLVEATQDNIAGTRVAASTVAGD